MRARRVAIVFGAALVCTLWASVGVERVVGDHEVGVTWTPFVKHRLSARIVFQNPAWQGLEVVSLQNLSLPERLAFAEFCQIRFGARDPQRCYELTNGQRL
jgi:hypothetical protein